MAAKPLNEMSGMPQVGGALSGWQMPIMLAKITEAVVEGFTQLSETVVKFKGVIQPLSPKQIELKPEGQRAFEWLQIHCNLGQLQLSTGDRIRYNGKLYKLMADNDWNLNGYLEYHVIRDYEVSKGADSEKAC